MKVGQRLDSPEFRTGVPLKMGFDKPKEIRENPCKPVAKVSA